VPGLRQKYSCLKQSVRRAFPCRNAREWKRRNDRNAAGAASVATAPEARAWFIVCSSDRLTSLRILAEIQSTANSRRKKSREVIGSHRGRQSVPLTNSLKPIETREDDVSRPLHSLTKRLTDPGRLLNYGHFRAVPRHLSPNKRHLRIARQGLPSFRPFPAYSAFAAAAEV
jgi:hypothetical protein